MSEDSHDGKPAITPAPNGPLLVRNLERLRNSKGDVLETSARIALCRCGGSANKPFCDGTHRRIGFSGENTAERSGDRVEDYAGPEVTIHDNRFLCAHAGACSDGLAAVFRYGKEPWIDPAGDSAERIMETIRRCPSGALGFTRQGRLHTDFERPAQVTVSHNGPYHVTGGIALEVEQRPQGASLEHYALCRCGASKNKPFCDGSHGEAHFEDEKN
jgi:CDGSH-type Zn-finger protein